MSQNSPIVVMIAKTFKWILFSLAMIPGLGMGLQCYECGSESFKGPCDKFNETDGFKVECSFIHNSCVSAKAKFGDVEVVRRHCGEGSESVCSEMTVGDAEATVCSCNSDACNLAREQTVSLAPFLVATLSYLVQGPVLMKWA